MYSIHITFEEKGKQPCTLSSIKGGNSLLEAILDNNIELHHNCGMVCACSTCHIYLEKGDQYVPEITDREEDFIDRARNPRLNSRLACQCVLEESESGEIFVKIPDQSLLHGE